MVAALTSDVPRGRAELSTDDRLDRLMTEVAMPTFSVSGADVHRSTPLSSPAMPRPMLTIVTHKTAD